MHNTFIYLLQGVPKAVKGNDGNQKEKFNKRDR